MIITSGDTLKKFTQHRGTWSPVKEITYYDTPYSVPSWGMKRVFYSNPAKDGVFADGNILNVALDPILAHSWGTTGPPAIGSLESYLTRWYTYFYASETGSYTFYLTFDDAARLYIANNTDKPEDLDSGDEITLTPADPNETGDNWSLGSIRKNMVMYTGSFSMTAGQWYPMKIEHGMFGGTDPSGEILVRYKEPSGSDRKVLSAGVCNYPVLDAWDDRGDAGFIDETMTKAYLNMPAVIGIKGDRGINKVGSYTVTFPVDDDEYMAMPGAKGV
jgi:hypothetical protein